MKKSLAAGKLLLPLFFCGTLLAGCANDTQKILDKMDLKEDEAALAKPIIEDFVKKTDKVFEQLAKQRPSGGPGGGPGGPGGPPPQGGDFSGSDRPDFSKTNPEMEKRKAEIEAKFALIDAEAVTALQKFLSAEKTEEFKLIAAEYREEKMKESMKGKGGPGGPGGREGPPER